MADDAPVRRGIHRARAHAIDRNRRGAAGALGRPGLQRKLVRILGEDPAVLPAVILVGHDLTVMVDRGAHVGEMGWAVIVPAVLVPAHELHAHGSPDLLRHDRRRLGGILVAAVPEDPGTLVIPYPHVADR